MVPYNFVVSFYGVRLLLHASIADIFTTYFIAVGCEAWIDPSRSLFTVQAE